MNNDEAPPPLVPTITQLDVTQWSEDSNDLFSGQAIATVWVPAGCSLMGYIAWESNPETRVATYGAKIGGTPIQGPTTMTQAFSYWRMNGSDWIHAVMSCEQPGSGTANASVSPDDYYHR